LLAGTCRILVIEKGRILESGTHEQLLTAKGQYHALYTRQFQQDREAGRSRILNFEV
jgi:ATP-binding cassette subfamily B protein